MKELEKTKNTLIREHKHTGTGEEKSTQDTAMIIILEINSNRKTVM